MSEKSEMLRSAIRSGCFEGSDCVTIRALLDSTHQAVPLFKDAILEGYSQQIYMPENCLFLNIVCDSLIPHKGQEDAVALREWLCDSIERHRKLAVCELYDALWSKSAPDIANNADHIKALYSDSLRHAYSHPLITRSSLLREVIRTGISRHIHVLSEHINSIFRRLDVYTKKKVLEWVLYSNVTVTEMPVLAQIDNEMLLGVKSWYDELNFFSSNISAPGKQTQTRIDHTIVPKILAQMHTCAASSREKDVMHKEIGYLLCEICKALEDKINKAKEDSSVPDAKYEPLLVGSAAEGTQALYIDEFDFILLRNTKHQKIDDYLIRVISDIKATRDHPGFVLSSMFLDADIIPCLRIAWLGQETPHYTEISIDLIDSAPLNKHVTLPRHNFLPVPREQQPDERTSTHPYQLRSRPNREPEPGKKSEQRQQNSSVSEPMCTTTIPRLYVDEFGNTVFSQVENALIKALPLYVREGYRLAKAIRITHVLRPIVPKLIRLGITDDIHNVIRSYHLKTCVFYLTQNHTKNDNDPNNNLWKWTIAIYRKLREFILLGTTKEFFNKKRNLLQRKMVKCIHDEKEFTQRCPPYGCCRLRKARLLMVDQILRVLCDSEKQYA